MNDEIPMGEDVPGGESREGNERKDSSKDWSSEYQNPPVIPETERRGEEQTGRLPTLKERPKPKPAG